MFPGMLVVLTPWIVRNYLLVHQFIPTMTIAGTSATHGLYVCKNFSFKANMGQQYSEVAKQLNTVAAQLQLPHRAMFFQYFYNAEDEVRFNQYLLNTVYDEYRKIRPHYWLDVPCKMFSTFGLRVGPGSRPYSMF